MKMMKHMNRLLLVLLAVSFVKVEAEQQQVRRRTAVCGDGACQDDENCVTCPHDCCGVPTDDDDLVIEERNLQVARSVNICASGPNQALPCATDEECGTVCSQNPTQLCNVDGQCSGDENLCSIIEGSCKLYVLATDAPSPAPSTSLMPSSELPLAESTMPAESVVPTVSPLPSATPTVSPAPSISSLPTSLPSSVPSPAPTETMMPSLFPSGGPSSQPTVSFFAMGDVPFSEQESCLLPYELTKLSSSGLGGQFLIHLGDVRDSYNNETLPCPEDLYKNLTSIFSTSPIQSFFLPGERGWLDCPDPEKAYDYWQEHLLSLSNDEWPTFPSDVARHSSRTELFSFVKDGVLFLGQSLPGPARDASYESSIREELIQDNIEWMEQAISNYIGEYMAVVVFGNDFSSAVNQEYLTTVISVANTELEEIPILLLQNGQSFRTVTEDQVTFRVSSIDLNATNVMWAQTDDTVTPISITVDPWAAELKEVFQFDRRCYCTFGHRPTRKKSYLPWERCAGVCDEGWGQCESLDSCSPPGNAC